MTDDFRYDVFLSHSSKDKAVVRALAEKLRADGLHVWFDKWEIRPGDSIPAKIEEGLEHSRVLVLCMSANAFASEWAELESGTFRFRSPLNKDRRFIPLRLDDTPIKGSLAQLLYINWLPEYREQEYPTLLEACRLPAEFAQTERAAGGVEFPKLIARKIRLTLGLEEDEPIPSARLQEIEVLDLEGDVTDADLVHLKMLSGLEELHLRGGGITDDGFAHLQGLSELRLLAVGNSPVTDAGLAYLKGLSQLRVLGLGNTRVTGAGLVHLKELPELRGLSLAYSQVTNVGLAHLKALSQLERLNLSRTKVTDAGLTHLKRLSELQDLYLMDTKVTDAAVRMLKGALPRLTIHR